MSRKGIELKFLLFISVYLGIVVWLTRCRVHTTWLTSGVCPCRLGPPSSDLSGCVWRRGHGGRRGSRSQIWGRECRKRGWRDKAFFFRETGKATALTAVVRVGVGSYLFILSSSFLCSNQEFCLNSTWHLNPPAQTSALSQKSPESTHLSTSKLY